MLRISKFYLVYLIRQIWFLFGLKWGRFYGFFLDVQERKTCLANLLEKPKVTGFARGLYDWSHGEFHLDLMKKYELRPNHVVLDFVCGYGRTAIPLIKFLDPHRYIGIELSKKRLELAKEWVKKENLCWKKPKFIWSLDNQLGYLDNESVDCVWTLSVFNHIPDSEVSMILSSLSRVLKQNGCLFFYFVKSNKQQSKMKTGSEVWAKFPRSTEMIDALLAENNFRFEKAEDWEKVIHYPKDHNSEMLIARKI